MFDKEQDQQRTQNNDNDNNNTYLCFVFYPISSKMVSDTSKSTNLGMVPKLPTEQSCVG